MKGVVISAKCGHATVACPGENFFAHATEIPPDEVGRRYLLEGEHVEFEPVDKGRFYRCAANVRILSSRASVDPCTYVEEGTVDKISRNGDFCFVLRPYGWVAMLHRDNVQEHESTHKDGSPLFFRGQVWSFRLSPPLEDDGRAWLAVNARELVAEESEAA